MDEDAFDLAGFCVGVVEEASLLGPHRVAEGDVRDRPRLHRPPCERLLARSDRRSCRRSSSRAPHRGSIVPLADELLEPCAIYAPDVVALARDGLLHAAAHVTGGGILENLPRAFPEGLGADDPPGSWPEHPIFGLVREASGASDDDLFATFNMGIGMLLVVEPDAADDVLARSTHRALTGSAR